MHQAKASLQLGFASAKNYICALCIYIHCLKLPQSDLPSYVFLHKYHQIYYLFSSMIIFTRNVTQIHKYRLGNV